MTPVKDVCAHHTLRGEVKLHGHLDASRGKAKDAADLGERAVLALSLRQGLRTLWLGGRMRMGHDWR
jgi:hypothetical protein